MTASFDGAEERERSLWLADLAATDGLPPAPLGSERQNDLARRLVESRRLAKPSGSQPSWSLEWRASKLQSDLQRLRIEPSEVFMPLGAARAVLFVVRELEILVLVLVLVLGLPLALWGIANHLPAWSTALGIARARSKEREMFATNLVLTGTLLFPLAAAIQIGIAALFLSPGWLALYALSLPLAGEFSVRWTDRQRKCVRRARVFLRLRRRRAQHLLIEQQARFLLADLDNPLGKRAEA